jgi:hypothetical protein
LGAGPERVIRLYFYVRLRYAVVPGGLSQSVCEGLTARFACRCIERMRSILKRARDSVAA